MDVEVARLRFTIGKQKERLDALEKTIAELKEQVFLLSAQIDEMRSWVDAHDTAETRRAQESARQRMERYLRRPRGAA